MSGTKKIIKLTLEDGFSTSYISLAAQLGANDLKMKNDQIFARHGWVFFADFFSRSRRAAK